MHDTIINSKLGSNGTAPEDTNVTAGEVFVSWLNNVNYNIDYLDYHHNLINT